MDEDQYRSTYRAINRRQCVFEKALLSRQCQCLHAHRFNLADREGVACGAPACWTDCQALLSALREAARFNLGLASVSSKLPHAKEMKVQVGGMAGVSSVLDDPPARVPDVGELVARGKQRFTSLDALPFAEILKSIAAFRGRRRGDKRNE